jgi:hypothetical protein
MAFFNHERHELHEKTNLMRKTGKQESREGEEKI